MAENIPTLDDFLDACGIPEFAGNLINAGCTKQRFHAFVKLPLGDIASAATDAKLDKVANNLFMNSIIKLRKKLGIDAAPPDQIAGIKRSHNSFEDSSPQVVKTLNNRSKTLPGVNDLLAFIDQEIPENMKISILQYQYDVFLSSDHKDPCVKADIDILFRISEAKCAFRLITMVTCKAIMDDAPPADSTDKTYIGFWDNNIKAPLEYFVPGGVTVRDTVNNTSTASKRHDFGYIFRNVCLFRGEEKQEGSCEDPKKELQDKFVWTYGDIPYILGYYAYGGYVTLVAICRPHVDGKPSIIDLVKTNLRFRRERIKNLKRMINICLLLEPIRDQIGFRTTPEFLPVINEDRMIEVLGTNVKKTYFGPYAFGKLAHLKRIYEFIKIKNVPNTDMLVKLKGSYEAYFEPKGIPNIPVNLKELVEAISCVLNALVIMHENSNDFPAIYHRDIRWENIVRLPVPSNSPSKWMLIDWEDASAAPTSAAGHLNKNSHAPEVFQPSHGGEVDVWAIGGLISEASRWKSFHDLPGAFLDKGKWMMGSPRPNAKTALDAMMQFQTGLI